MVLTVLWACSAQVLRPEHWDKDFVAPLWVGTVTVYSVLWVQCPVLFSQPYVPKKPPVLRVTEGPFFSEVAAYYEHFHQVIRLYNLPG